MNQQWFILIGVLSLCIAYEVKAQNEEPVMVTIDAAYGYNIRDKHYLILFSGDQAQTLIDYSGDRIRDRETYHLPSSMHVQAAYTRPGSPFNRRYFGDKYGVNVKSTTEAKRIKYGRQRAFLRNGGPDAAGKRGGDVYFFKGCEMVARTKFGKWGKIQDMEAKGLPCDIHAAWTEQEKMVLLRGDLYWTWEQDDSVTGPHDFHEKYTLLEWTLAPETK